MDIIDKIVQEKGNLNDLYYILASNNLTVTDIRSNSYGVKLAYPNEVTKPYKPVLSTEKALTKIISVSAYQSVFDVCVQYYGTIGNIQDLLSDNKLTINDYLEVGSFLSIRTDGSNNKIVKTLAVQQKAISNFDRVIPSDQDIYLGTENGDFIGATTSVKIKVN